MLFGLTALFAIVMVGVPVPLPPGVGVGDGDVVPLLVEPPPHAATTSASPPAAAKTQVAFLPAPIMLALLKPTLTKSSTLLRLCVRTAAESHRRFAGRLRAARLRGSLRIPRPGPVSIS